MSLKLLQALFSLSTSVPWAISLVCLFGVSARRRYDIVCPDTDNPLNIPFTVPTETLVDGTIRDVDPIAIDFIDPRDVACKTNYEDITVEDFKPAVICNLKGTQGAICEVNPKCTAHRKEILSRIRKATLRVLDEVVLKIEAVRFFNNFRGAKWVLFYTVPLADLNGVEIVKRATYGQTNVQKGFQVPDRYSRIHRDWFNKTFSKPIELYAKLRTAEDPTGLLADHNRCIRSMYNIPSDLHFCYDHFFNGFKERSKLHPRDSKLLSLLDEALEFVVNHLTDGQQHFSEVKIPFSGDCIGSHGLEPDTTYSSLVGLVENLTNIKRSK